MTYSLSRDDLYSVTDLELAFSTQRLLPDWADIPQDFKEGNVYTNLVDAIFGGQPMPDMEMHFKEGFADADAGALFKCVRAHLTSFGPKHEHKIAGVAFLMAQTFDLLPATTTSS